VTPTAATLRRCLPPATALLGAVALLFGVAGSFSSGDERKPNRLAKERSPYLRQHADNPVDWYPWGEEAFAKARREGKPVLLSIGYSACHWCHVMEHESFEDEEVARVLSEGFVAVKVDREERPDVDDVYMTACLVVQGSGGWPLTAILTPTGRPFFAGTYFPKKVFLELLGEVSRLWKEDRKEAERHADEIVARMRHLTGAGPEGEEGAGAVRPAAKEALERALAAWERVYDREHKGFGGAPKFPPHQALRLLLVERERAGARARAMALETLDAIAAGGIHDHVGGGFHRYAVDREWRVPHFEKMLYDQALLGRAYVEAFAATGDARHAEVARGIFDFVRRELLDGAGGFHASLDADSEGEEGRFYTWTPAELEAVLGGEGAAAFAAAYGVTTEGSFEHGRSVLHLTAPPGKRGIANEAAARAKLLEARAKRVRPALDDKVIPSWNGLMIGALARGSTVLAEPRYAAEAARAATAVLDSGLAKNIFLDDLAFLADGLLDLHEATGEKRWLDAARGLLDRAVEGYWDEAGGGGFFFTADDHEKLLLRAKDPFDGAIPAGNGVAARALARLGKATGERAYLDRARATLDAFAGPLARAPQACPSLVEAAFRVEAAGETPRKALVVLKAEPLAAPLRAGETKTLALDVGIAPPFHLTGREPTEEGLIPIALDVKADREGIVEPGAPRYPPGAEYREKVVVEVPLKGVAAGETRLTLTLRFQPCDEERCLEPTSATTGITLRVEP